MSTMTLSLVFTAVAYNDSMQDLELVDIITEQGTAVRQELKTDAHLNGWLHKTVIGYLRYDNEWALVRQAADRQDAGQLVAPVGGHVQAGELDIDALRREAEEEIGTRNITSAYIGSAVFHRQIIGRDENHMFVVYEISTPDAIRLGNEAVALERFSTEALRQALRERPGDFGEAFYFVLEKFYPDYLPDTRQTRWNDVPVWP